MHDHLAVTSEWLGELLAPGRLPERVQNSGIHGGFLSTRKPVDDDFDAVRITGSASTSYAMRWEFFDHNPIPSVRQSTKRTRVPDVLTVEEIGKLLGELADPWRTPLYVAVTTGLRVSELLGLKWADMDFTAGVIHLSRGIVRQQSVR
jgi:integrase